MGRPHRVRGPDQMPPPRGGNVGIGAKGPVRGAGRGRPWPTRLAPGSASRVNRRSDLPLAESRRSVPGLEWASERRRLPKGSASCMRWRPHEPNPASRLSADGKRQPHHAAGPTVRLAERSTRFRERTMALLKNLFGDGSKDRELAEDMRALLQEVRQERERFAQLLESSHGASDAMHDLIDPIAKASSDINAVTARLKDMEERLAAVSLLGTQLEDIGQRAEHIARSQKETESTMNTVLEDSQQIRTVFEELSQKVDLAVSLRERLETFLEVEKPFSLIHGEADQVRSQVEATSEHLGRLREQHERLMDHHKLATQKMEALDRRRDDLSRDLQDKERRVISVEQGVRGLDGIRHTVDEVKRELGAMKAASDSLAQKTWPSRPSAKRWTAPSRRRTAS